MVIASYRQNVNPHDSRNTFQRPVPVTEKIHADGINVGPMELRGWDLHSA